MKETQCGADALSCLSVVDWQPMSLWKQIKDLGSDVAVIWRWFPSLNLQSDGAMLFSDSEFEEALSGPEVPWDELLETGENNAWRLLSPEQSPLGGWSDIYRISVSEDSSGLLALVSKEKKELNACTKNTIAWLAGGLVMLQERSAKTQRLEDLRHLMVCQSVWLECVEWLKTVEVENEKFYRDVLSRATLLASADYSVLMLQKPEIRQFKWHGRLPNTDTMQTLQQWMQTIPIQVATAVNSSPPVVQMESGEGALMVVPMSSDHFIYKGMIFLGKHTDKPAFGLLEEMYLNQFVSHCSSTLERSTLIATLANRHKELIKERKKEQVLIDQLQMAQTQLIQSEKLASIGQLAAGVAHEINNPVGYVTCNVRSLDRYSQTLWQAMDRVAELITELNTAEGTQKLKTIMEEEDLEFMREDMSSLIKETQDGLERVKRIVQDLKDFSRADSGEFLPVDLQTCIDKSLNIVHNEVKYKAEIIKHIDALPPIELVESQFSQVLMNLVINAVHAMESSGTITISAQLCSETEVRVSVKDTGSGIPPEFLAKIFDPFFTSKPVGKGTGLGLSISYGIVQRHHGKIEVETELGKGTTFHLFFPLVQPKQE